MTAAGDARDAAARIGADGHLAKPFELVELVELVARLLGRSHLSAVPADQDGRRYADAAAGG
jgi:hypothetical protein